MGQKGDHRRVLRTKILSVLTAERSYQFYIQIEHLHAKVPLLKLTGKIRIFGRICPKKRHRPTLYDRCADLFLKPPITCDMSLVESIEILR